MGKLKERIRQRREKLLSILPTNPAKGMTFEEIANAVGYSIATIRVDLNSLRAEKLVECDDSRRPYKWYKTNKKGGRG